MATLHLLMGLPGSGKTTLGKHLASLTGAIHLSSDDYRLVIYPKPTFNQEEHDNLYAILDHMTKHLLESGVDVIYDANLNRKKHREEKYHLAQELGVNVRLWWVKTDSTLAKRRRIDDQNHMLLPEGETPESMFDRISIIFEPPTHEEEVTTIDGTHITSEHVKDLLERN